MLSFDFKHLFLGSIRLKWRPWKRPKVKTLLDLDNWTKGFNVFLFIQGAVEKLLDSIKDERASRLFAVVMVGGSQYKVTTEDMILVRNSFYPTIGDKIRLEKVTDHLYLIFFIQSLIVLINQVLLVGGKDWSVVGKPLVRFDI